LPQVYKLYYGYIFDLGIEPGRYPVWILPATVPASRGHLDCATICTSLFTERKFSTLCIAFVQIGTSAGDIYMHRVRNLKPPFLHLQGENLCVKLVELK